WMSNHIHFKIQIECKLLYVARIQGPYAGIEKQTRTGIINLINELRNIGSHYETGAVPTNEEFEQLRYADCV
ncbi:hypothetical protein STEG23_015281, partial [Scotinomys teguina]